MALAVLVALACGALAAAGARYGDYAGARMPQYGGGDYDARAAPPSADDYQDHSPDAPASLDYKYEEVSSDKIDKPVPTDTQEDDTWNKPVKKSMNEKSIDGVEPEGLNKYKLDESPKFQNTYRDKIEARHRNKNKIRTEEVLRRRGAPGRDAPPIQRADEDDNHLHMEDLRDDNLEIEDENDNFDRREIKPKVRRKPRDRPNINTLLKLDNDEEENLGDIRDIQKSLRVQPLQSGENPRYAEPEERAKPLGGRRAGGAADDDDDDLVAPLPGPGAALARTKKPFKNYDEYADYYDMKKPHFKKKTRRTKARTTTPPAPRRFIPYRRTHRPFRRRTEEPPTTATPPATDTPLDTAYHSPIMRKFLPPSTSTLATSIAVDGRRSHEMSIAEKSRLSILKKAQRKESSRNGTSTEKPPVLLQVTEKMNTIVMVEPPLHQDPWMRAKEVSDDTPQRLRQVKKLMRRKLVANAKDIRELSDNWNDVVCDYIDVGMLDAHATFIHTLKTYNLLLLTLPVVYLIY